MESSIIYQDAETGRDTKLRGKLVYSRFEKKHPIRQTVLNYPMNEILQNVTINYSDHENVFIIGIKKTVL